MPIAVVDRDVSDDVAGTCASGLRVEVHLAALDMQVPLAVEGPNVFLPDDELPSSPACSYPRTHRKILRARDGRTDIDLARRAVERSALQNHTARCSVAH